MNKCSNLSSIPDFEDYNHRNFSGIVILKQPEKLKSTNPFKNHKSLLHHLYKEVDKSRSHIKNYLDLGTANRPRLCIIPALILFGSLILNSYFLAYIFGEAGIAVFLLEKLQNSMY